MNLSTRHHLPPQSRDMCRRPVASRQCHVFSLLMLVAYRNGSQGTCIRTYGAQSGVCSITCQIHTHGLVACKLGHQLTHVRIYTNTTWFVTAKEAFNGSTTSSCTHVRFFLPSVRTLTERQKGGQARQSRVDDGIVVVACLFRLPALLPSLFLFPPTQHNSQPCMRDKVYFPGVGATQNWPHDCLGYVAR